MSLENNFEKGKDTLEKEQKRIDGLWKRFHLNGQPPKAGTPVMDRLTDNCRSYLDFITNSKVSNMTSSDSIRRDIHNQIAIMVDGKKREDMSFDRAEEIAEFASFLVHKVSIGDLEDMMNNLEKN